MKQYKITKIIFAKSIIDAIKKEKESEIVEIFLNEEIKKDEKVGFK